MTKNEEKTKLNQPDSFQANSMMALDWIVKNQKLVLMITGSLVGVVLIGYGIQKFQQSKKDSRLAELGKIAMQYDAAEKKVDDERKKLSDQLVVLQTKLSLAEKSATPAADAKGKAKAEPANSHPLIDKAAVEKEKAELEKKVKDLKADHMAEATAFQSFGETHKANVEGWLATIRAASILKNAKKYEEAIALAQKVKDASKSSTFYQFESRFMLLGLYEQTAKFDDGIKVAEELAGLAGSDAELLPQILLAKGRLLVLKKDNEQATKILSEIIEKYGTAPEAQKAKALKGIM